MADRDTGTSGEEVILNIIMEMSGRLPKTPPESHLTTVRWVGCVLLPEIINLLIMEDLNVNYEVANRIRLESSEAEKEMSS